ncbi:hypothetical protein C1X05_13465 [Laceyella sacchari]|nr:hypothetical protein C1X05_13465 [Laceyella sacchari]
MRVCQFRHVRMNGSGEDRFKYNIILERLQSFFCNKIIFLIFDPFLINWHGFFIRFGNVAQEWRGVPAIDGLFDFKKIWSNVWPHGIVKAVKLQ